MSPPRIIKKSNRRLYDTETSTYITLAEVKDLVLGRSSGQDAKADDLTRDLPGHRGSGGCQCSPMLANIILLRARCRASWAPTSARSRFHEAQKRFQEQAQSLYGELPKMPAEVWTQVLKPGQQIPNVMGGYLEKGAKAVIDMQEELRTQALKLFSGFPYGANDATGGVEAPAKAPKAAKAARKPRAKK
jgi:polyhydroxyalkanoate synthesis regulator protein